MLGVVFTGNIAASIHSVFLGTMPTHYLAANLIDPALAVRVGGGMNVFLTHKRYVPLRIDALEARSEGGHPELTTHADPLE